MEDLMEEVTDDTRDRKLLLNSVRQGVQSLVTYANLISTLVTDGLLTEVSTTRDHASEAKVGEQVAEIKRKLALCVRPLEQDVESLMQQEDGINRLHVLNTNLSIYMDLLHKIGTGTMPGEIKPEGSDMTMEARIVHLTGMKQNLFKLVAELITKNHGMTDERNKCATTLQNKIIRYQNKLIQARLVIGRGDRLVQILEDDLHDTKMRADKRITKLEGRLTRRTDRLGERAEQVKELKRTYNGLVQTCRNRTERIRVVKASRGMLRIALRASEATNQRLQAELDASKASHTALYDANVEGFCTPERKAPEDEA